MKEEELLSAFISSTKEERKEFWRQLEDYCEKNGIEKKIYHPYIPLQVVNVNEIPSQTSNTSEILKTSVKTRYGDLKIDG